MWPSNPICTLVIFCAFIPGAISIATRGRSEQTWSFDGTAFALDGIEDDLPSGGGGNVKGWLGRWLSVGGEGEVTVHLSAANITLPHRPAAFPGHVPSAYNLPISGTLVNFVSLPPPERDQYATATTPRDTQACVPASTIRWIPPSKPYIFALVERGGCDFATKVRAAQERGAAGVIVGDTMARIGETDEEGRERESLITMFSPEDTDNIFIPSVFVSRASYLLLRDILAREKESGKEGAGLWVDLGEGEQEGGALSSLLSFALLMPSFFLLGTIAIHRIRVARQREADRAPPIVVLSLPERIWSPDIAWEKDDSSSDSSDTTTPRASAPASPSRTRPQFNSKKSSLLSIPTTSGLPPPPPISASDVAPSPVIDMPLPSTSRDSRTRKQRTKSSQRYFSKDECAICMDLFQRGEVVRILPCGHVFHKDECDEWLMKWRKLCPTCRADVTIPPGATAEGSTMTPIAPVPVDEQDENRGIASSINAVGTWLRGLLPQRIRLRGSDSQAERAPLVASPNGR